jgi:TetR/AcrR family transcriptional repressor of nem operon
MHLFWDRGYHAASVEDLVREMGIHRGSLYDTFGDKHSLFLEALRHYESVYASKLVGLLDGEPSGRRAVEKFFRKVAADCSSEKGGRGCFFANSIVEMFRHDPETARALGKGFSEIERALFRAVKRGQDAGEISRRLGPRETARFFAACLVGLRVVEKSSPSPRVLKDIVRGALSVMEG